MTMDNGGRWGLSTLPLTVRRTLVIRHENMRDKGFNLATFLPTLKVDAKELRTLYRKRNSRQFSQPTQGI
jgi:hypothetical protein